MCIFSQLVQSLCMIYNSHSHFFAKLVFILVWFTLCDFTCPHFFHLFPQLSQGSLFRSVDHFMFPCMCSFISLSPTILTITTLQDHCDPLDVHLVCHFFPTILTVKTYSSVDHFMFLDNSNNQNRIVFL